MWRSYMKTVCKSQNEIKKYNGGGGKMEEKEDIDMIEWQ